MGTDQVVIRDFAYSTKSNLRSSPITVTDPTDQEGFEGFSSPNEGSGLSPEARSRVNRNEEGSYQVRGGTQTSGSNLDGTPATIGTYNRVHPSLQHFQYYRDPNKRDYPPFHVAWTPTGLLALPIMIDVLAVTVALTSLIRFDRDLDGPGFVHPRDDVYIVRKTKPLFERDGLIATGHVHIRSYHWGSDSQSSHHSNIQLLGRDYP